MTFPEFPERAVILTQADIDSFVKAYSIYQSARPDEFTAWRRFIAWLSDNPQVLIAGHFQEFVAAHHSPLFRSVCRRRPGAVERCPRPIFREYAGRWILLSDVGESPTEEWDGYPLDDLRRLAKTGHVPTISDRLLEEHYSITGALRVQAWVPTDLCDRIRGKGYADMGDWRRLAAELKMADYEVDSVEQESNEDLLMRLRENIEATTEYFRAYEENALADEIEETCVVTLPSANQMLSKARRVLDSPLTNPTSLISPRIWTPASQTQQASLLQTIVPAIIREIQAERRSLRELHWRTLEEIVAELLRDRGMEIHVVREAPQGGRDIIARGILIPHMEPVTLAVEVKHKEWVDRPEVQLSLAQNRQFPALLFATSGRFTGGVLQEAELPENRMRLFLKDGVAIGDMLKLYPLARQLRRARGAGVVR
jgi:hypothetical protein